MSAYSLGQCDDAHTRLRPCNPLIKASALLIMHIVNASGCADRPATSSLLKGLCVTYTTGLACDTGPMLPLQAGRPSAAAARPLPGLPGGVPPRAAPRPAPPAVPSIAARASAAAK